MGFAPRSTSMFFSMFFILSLCLSCLLQKVRMAQELSGLPNANAKSQRFSYAISQIATLPPVVALNCTQPETVGTVSQDPELHSTETEKNSLPERNCRNRKQEPPEPSRARTVTEPNLKV